MKKNYLSLKGYFILLVLLLQFFNAKAQQTYTYNYTGAVQTVNLPAGIYQVECWGADGGGTTGTNSNAAVLKLGGKGGYATGTLTIPASTTASVYVGGKGNTEGVNVSGGFNGGGNSGAGASVSGVCGSGGGASDIRIGGNAFSDRKIVAGGGGAAGYQECNGTAGVISGGHGGGAVGGDPVIGAYAARIGHGGTQTAGGAGGTDATYAAGNAGSFGLGANGGTASATSGNGAGGGGGWYGGGSGSNGFYCAGGGGGGSSYIGGVTNGVTIMFGQPGFVPNPDVTGDGYVIITALNTPINVAATSSAICIGSGPVTMTASGVTTYTWLPVGSFAGSNSAIISDNPTSTTVYTVQGTDALGLSVSQFTVYVNDPHVNIVPSNTVICLGQSIPFVASGASSYSWSSQNGGFSTVTSGTLVFDSNTMPSGSYNIIGTDLIGCVAPTQTAEVTVLSPAAAISGPSITCKGNYYTLSASGADTYTWSTGSNSSSISVSPNVNTVYTLIGGQSQGNVTCYSTASLSIAAYNSPGVGAISNRNNICSGENVLLTAIGANNYTWTNGVTTHTGSTWQVNPISNQTTSSQGYTVTGSNQYNCSNTSTIAIKVNPCTGIAENNGVSRISIYPNPNKGEFVISAAQAMELQIINEVGQVVKTIKIDKDKTEIKLNQLSNGIYFIVGKGEQGTVKEKIIVEK